MKNAIIIVPFSLSKTTEFIKCTSVLFHFFPNQQDLQNLMDNTCFESWMSQSRTDNYSLNCTDKKNSSAQA